MKLLALILLLLPTICIAQDSWELKKNEDGIAVYTRKLDNEKFKEIHVVCEINGNIKQLYGILQNVNHHKDWVYGTMDSHLINRNSADTIYYYSSVHLPWPASDRDLTVQLILKRDNNDKTLHVHAMGINNLLPKKPKLVRVPYSLGLWNVSTLNGNKIKIDYIFSVDPGGSLPAWLVNMMAVRGPFNTFKNLKGLMENGK